jgi:hypothetical protein
VDIIVVAVFAFVIIFWLVAFVAHDYSNRDGD